MNYDFSEYEKLIDILKIYFEEKNEEEYLKAADSVNEIIKAMPLYRDFTHRFDLLKDYYFNPFFEKTVDKNPYKHFEKYLRLLEDLRITKEKYTNFIDEIFYKTYTKITKDKYAYQIENNCMSAFISGISLGENLEVDPASVSMQYEVRESKITGKPHLFEKIIFTDLLTFVYVSLFKGIMIEFIPKKCKLCGKYFLQEPGHSYEYCENSSPDYTDKTCRDIGSRKSFSDKASNDDIWKIYLRAYKKYHARIKSKKMLPTEFEAWASKAEDIRIAALRERTELKKLSKNFDLIKYEKDINCI